MADRVDELRKLIGKFRRQAKYDVSPSSGAIANARGFQVNTLLDELDAALALPVEPLQADDEIGDRDIGFMPVSTGIVAPAPSEPDMVCMATKESGLVKCTCGKLFGNWDSWLKHAQEKRAAHP